MVYRKKKSNFHFKISETNKDVSFGPTNIASVSLVTGCSKRFFFFTLPTPALAYQRYISDTSVIRKPRSNPTVDPRRQLPRVSPPKVCVPLAMPILVGLSTVPFPQANLPKNLLFLLPPPPLLPPLLASPSDARRRRQAATNSKKVVPEVLPMVLMLLSGEWIWMVRVE